MQSEEARRGLELWSGDQGADLEVVDTRGSPEAAYGDRLGGDLLLLGPYGSGQVRRVLRVVGGEAVMWNHGGSADDLARPWAPMVAAPASGYFAPLVDLAVEIGCGSLTVVQGRGRFAESVAGGAIRHAHRSSLEIQVAPIDSWDPASLSPESAMLAVGRFDEDVAVIRSARSRLVGCVAAGIPSFLEAAGAAAEGVLGPVQWLPTPRQPEVGPSGTEFQEVYRRRYRTTPSYVAAQAAATGYLAASASLDDLTDWSPTTMLGRFQVDADGLQIGHGLSVIRWREGRMEPVG